MWFSYENQPAHWHVLSVADVKEILAKNKQKIRISAIEDFVVEATKEIEKNFQNVVGQDSLTRFDQKPKKKNNKNKKRRKPTNFKNGPKKE